MSQYHDTRAIHGLDIAHLLYSTGMDGYDRTMLIDFGPGDADSIRAETRIHWADARMRLVTLRLSSLRRLQTLMREYHDAIDIVRENGDDIGAHEDKANIRNAYVNAYQDYETDFGTPDRVWYPGIERRSARTRTTV